MVQLLESSESQVFHHVECYICQVHNIGNVDELVRGEGVEEEQSGEVEASWKSKEHNQEDVVEKQHNHDPPWSLLDWHPNSLCLLAAVDTNEVVEEDGGDEDVAEVRNSLDMLDQNEPSWRRKEGVEVEGLERTDCHQIVDCVMPLVGEETLQSPCFPDAPQHKWKTGNSSHNGQSELPGRVETNETEPNHNDPESKLGEELENAERVDEERPARAALFDLRVVEHTSL